MISSVLVWMVMMRLLPIGQSCSEETLTNFNQTNCDICPPGYHASEAMAGGYQCKRCERHTFTAIKNYVSKCERCSTCDGNGMNVLTECVYNRDALCVCQDGWFPNYFMNKLQNCFPCSGLRRDADIRKECIRTPPEPRNLNQGQKSTSATILITSTGHGRSEGRLEPSRPSPSPPTEQANNNTMLMVVIVAVVAAAVAFLICNWLTAVARILYRTRLPVASDDPESNSLGWRLTAQENHRPSNMTLHACEEAPAMLISQGLMAAYPSHQQPLLRPMEAPASALPLTSCPPPLTLPPSLPPGERWPPAALYALIQEVPLRRWKELLRHLGVAEQQMERVEVEAGAACLGSRERQYQMLRLWTQRPASALPEVYAALQRMELAGCAQLLRERLGALGGAGGQSEGPVQETMGLDGGGSVKGPSWRPRDWTGGAV
ncbi:tumor necrosis factor receptor superfamily member 25 isoform X1 [Gadus morhua]|uniref:tumor necrosis factor receptor superfamily member 25 isoform X1 n=2 Tax=Gadus morhua TaxID=8049 RepID=UPI0011B837B3|nr:tumor necrosis factor receptor superfamily member 25-like isoform X1 [Gadus morhua]